MLRRLWGWFARLEEAQFEAIKTVLREHEYRFARLEARKGLSADPAPPSGLQCSTCLAIFSTRWELVEHQSSVCQRRILPFHLDVVAVTASPDMDYLWRVKRAMIRAEAWWLEQVGVKLEVNLSLVSSTVNVYERADNDAVEAHYLRPPSSPYTAYVVDADTVGEGHWGVAVGYHGFVVVRGWDEDLIGPLVAHELGHVLLDQYEHTEDTFLRRDIQADDNVVTPEQRAAIRRAL
jgi:hypothetical protein